MASLQKFLKLSKNKNLKICEDKSNSSGTFDMIGSNHKLSLLNNWKPEISLEKSLENTLESFRRKHR